MGFKSVNERLALDLRGLFSDLAEDALMAEVHPVEVPNGQNRIFESPLEIFFLADNFHIVSISLEETKINLSAFQIGCIHPDPYAVPQAEDPFLSFPDQHVLFF